jgi:hypothetical protein
MADPTDPAAKRLAAGYLPVPTVPIIYFDFAPTFGHLGGNIQIELAARIVLPLEDGTIDNPMIETGRLRCSKTAAVSLKNALEQALKMLDEPQTPPVGRGTLN